MSLLLLAACELNPCTGGDIRGIATMVSPEAGGTVHLYDGGSRADLEEISVEGYRRFVFHDLAAGDYVLAVEYIYSDPLGVCDCWSDEYAVTVCDGPVEVYPGDDPPTEQGEGCTCSD